MVDELRLFDLPAKPGSVGKTFQVPEGSTFVRVLLDVPGLDKELDYAVSPELVSRVAVGSIVWVMLNSRRVEGWVTAVDVSPDPELAVRPIVDVRSVGPTGDVIELARWAAHRWAGRVLPVVKAASPERLSLIHI